MRPERRCKGRNGQGRPTRRPKLKPKTPSSNSLLPAQNGLDNGVHFTHRDDRGPSSDRNRADCWSRVHCGESLKTFRIASRKRFSSSAEHVMAVFDLIDHGSQFAAQTLTQPYTEDLADAIGCQTPEPDFTASLEELVDLEMTFENEIAAVFDLRDGVETRQVHLSPFPLGELGSHHQGQVIERFRDDASTQPFGTGPQFGRISLT